MKLLFLSIFLTRLINSTLYSTGEGYSWYDLNNSSIRLIFSSERVTSLSKRFRAKSKSLLKIAAPVRSALAINGLGKGSSKYKPVILLDINLLIIGGDHISSVERSETVKLSSPSFLSADKMSFFLHCTLLLNVIFFIDSIDLFCAEIVNFTFLKLSDLVPNISEI